MGVKITDRLYPIDLDLAAKASKVRTLHQKVGRSIGPIFYKHKTQAPARSLEKDAADLAVILLLALVCMAMKSAALVPGKSVRPAFLCDKLTNERRIREDECARSMACDR
jgi:hypothetical protein